VVVNDKGVDLAGNELDDPPARRVVEEINTSGGHAILSGHDIADWDQAEDLVRLAIESFGGLHILVNNAGIIRDRMLANMSEADWDDVVRVHLKGHAAPSRHATAYWRSQAKATGTPVAACVIHTTAASGFVGAFGQANYSAAKLGIIGLSKVIATECHRYGVRSNVISPLASTRMSASSQIDLRQPTGVAEASPSQAPASSLDTRGISAVLAWLAEEQCVVNDQILHLYANRCVVLQVASPFTSLQSSGPIWTIDELQTQLSGEALAPPATFGDYFEGLEVIQRR